MSKLKQREIESFIEKWSRVGDSIEDFKFYILSFNILCNPSKTEYIPVELGITSYSIRLGIEDSFHNFIKPGAVPKGYMGISKNISDSTHKIPIMGFTLASGDYANVYQSVMNFISPKEEPIMFCNEEEILQNERCLEWLYNRSKSRDTHSVRIYDVTLLLMKLSEYAGHPFASMDIAAEAFNSHAFDYIPNSRCDYHEEIDNDFCALGRTKRLCFILSSKLCKLFKICPMEQHIPPKKAKYEAQQLNLASLPTFSRFPKKKSLPNDHSREIKSEVKPPHPKSSAVHQDDNLHSPKPVSSKDQSFTNQVTAVSPSTVINKDFYVSENRPNRLPFSLPKVLIDDPYFRSQHKASKPFIFRQPHSMPKVLRAQYENVDFYS